MHDRLGKKLMRWRHRVVLPQLRGRAMDIGCGYNDLIREYRETGGEGVGVDVYPWPGADRVVDDTAVLDYPDQSFDSVAIIAALNHIPNREAVLREVHRLLRPDGRIVLTMIPPRLSWLWHTLRKPWDADQTERGMKAGEVYGLTGRQVHDLLERTGFAPLKDRRFMLGLNRLTVAEKVPTPTPAAESPRPAHAPQPLAAQQR